MCSHRRMRPVIPRLPALSNDAAHSAILWVGLLIMHYHYVYILVSESDPSRHYTGCATEITERLKKHNEGEVPHTRKYRPWRIEIVIRFSSKTKARAFEKYLKSGSGREFARRHF